MKFVIICHGVTRDEGGVTFATATGIKPISQKSRNDESHILQKQDSDYLLARYQKGACFPTFEWKAYACPPETSCGGLPPMWVCR